MRSSQVPVFNQIRNFSKDTHRRPRYQNLQKKNPSTGTLADTYRRTDGPANSLKLISRREKSYGDLISLATRERPYVLM